MPSAPALIGPNGTCSVCAGLFADGVPKNHMPMVVSSPNSWAALAPDSRSSDALVTLRPARSVIFSFIEPDASISSSTWNATDLYADHCCAAPSSVAGSAGGRNAPLVAAARKPAPVSSSVVIAARRRSASSAEAPLRTAYG